ncbi:MAG TPA: DNA polymerase III subunit beta [bacterium]|nr:DNA polymerase III subunit beta [bacterium]
MKIIVGKEDLVKATQIAQNGTSTRNTLPHLSSFYLETKENSLEIVATDLEIAIRCQIPVQIKSKGKITIPGKKFTEIVRELPGEEVTIEETEDNRIAIRAKSDIYRLSSISTEDFPQVPEFNKNKVIKLDRDRFQEMLIKTSFSASTDESRYVLCGVFCILEKGKIKLVATDGRRMALDIAETEDKNAKGKVIIPNKTVSTFLKLLNFSTSKEILLNIEENMIAFLFDSIYLSSRIIDGSFPNYDQVIPKSQAISVILPTEEILKATRRVSLITNERSRTVKYSFKKGKIQISAQTEGVGEGLTEIPIEYNHQEIDIAFNPQFVMDVLKHIESQQIEIGITNSLNPATFKEKDKENYINVIMPMRV